MSKLQPLEFYLITEGINFYGREFTVINEGRFNCKNFILNKWLSIEENWITGALVTFLGETAYSIIPLDLCVIPVPIKHSNYNKLLSSNSSYNFNPNAPIFTPL